MVHSTWVVVGDFSFAIQHVEGIFIKGPLA
jgi:hypothetical protein